MASLRDADGSRPSHPGGDVGTLIGIARRLRPRAPMVLLTETGVTPEEGVIGDYRGRAKPGGRVTRRQVSVLRQEDWAAAEAELGCVLPWTMRRANLLIAGLALPQVAGTVLAIGTVRLRVTVECDPCRRMDEQHDGLWPALVPGWRGGYLATVIAGGHARLGDSIRIET